MSTESDKLRSMINAAPEQVDNLNNSIAQIEDLMEEVSEEIDAIQDALMDVAQTDLTGYLEVTKVDEIEVIHGGEVEVVYGATFGTSTWGPPKGNISDWEIVDSTSKVAVYVYLGVGWDGDTTITTLITDYSFGNDYLWKPLTDGASYGRYPYYDSLNTGKGYLENNRDKINNSINVFQDYAT